MRAATIILLIFALALFALSMAALIATPEVHGVMTLAPATPVRPEALVLPESTALRGLALVTALVLALHVGSLLRPRGPRGMRSSLWLSVSLLSGAAWPWVAETSPLAGAVCALVMAAAAGFAAQAGGRLRVRDGGFGFYFGFAIATGAAISAVALVRLGLLGPQTAGVLGIAALTLATLAAQQRWPGALSVTVAALWALIGLAASTLGVAPVLTWTAVVGVAALCAALVRAAT